MRRARESGGPDSLSAHHVPTTCVRWSAAISARRTSCRLCAVASGSGSGCVCRYVPSIDNDGWSDAEPVHGYGHRHHIVRAFRQMKNADRIAVRLPSGRCHAHADDRPSAPRVRDSLPQAVRLPSASGTFEVLLMTCLSPSRQTDEQSPPSEPGTLGRRIGGLPSLRIRSATRGDARNPQHGCNVIARSLGDLRCPPRWN